ncbi:MAG TPA: hypothetical protein VMN76_02475 [Acidobacteriota bacterium]|nr:hypothetical protein [Acidobacteriota bacterium]
MQRKITCPRCGSEFKTTVPWRYFQFLFFVLVACALLYILLYTSRGIGVLTTFILAVVVFFWYLPRLIDLEQISGSLPALEGPLDEERMRLKMKRRDWEEEEESDEAPWAQYHLTILLVVLLLLLGIVLLTR